MKNINENCKKYFYILFTLLFFTSVFTLTGISKEEAAATETSTATYSSATPQISYSVTGNKTVGSTITIAVNVTNGANIYGGSLDLLFDSNMLEITSAKMGSLFEKDLKAPLINDTKTPGRTSIVVTLSGANKKLSVTNGSLVIINAKVKKEGTLNLKTTNDLSYLNLSRYTSCIKLSDSHGSKINYKYTDSITTFSKLNLTDYEENNSLIKYNGNWIVDSNSHNSGSTAKYSNIKGAYFSFSFNGTGFEWYGMANKYKGIANIYIDDKLITSIDTYSSSTQYSKLFYENNSLNKGNHTVKIEVSGNKSSNASGTYISLDKIDIINGNMISNDTFTPYQENNSLIKYIGNWITDSNSYNSGSTAKYSNIKGAYFTFSFNGTGFKWYGMANKYKGIANIYIDDKLIASIDTYSSSTQYSKLFYENNSLNKGNHTIKIEVSGNKSSNAAGTYISLDKIDIINGILK